MKKTVAIIAACAAGGYVGFCVGFITLSIDAAWKGVLHTGYEAELGIFIGVLFACVAGALGGVVRAGRFGAYLGSLSFAALFVWMCWAIIQDLSLRHFQITVGELIGLVEVALAFALGLVVAKRMVSSPRFQFSMKTLLLLMMMCALAFGLASVRGQLKQKWEEREAEETPSGPSATAMPQRQLEP